MATKRPEIVSVSADRMRSIYANAITHIFSMLWVDLTISGPIVPGQPIGFSWKSDPFFLTAQDLGTTVMATLYPVDSLGDANLTFPLHQETVSGSTLAAGIYTSPPRSFTAVGPIAKTIYKINGPQTLILVLMGNGPKPGPYVSDLMPVQVMEERGVRSWFDLYAPSNADWKQPYTVSASYKNQSKYTTLRVSPFLEETDNQGWGLTTIPSDASQYAVLQNQLQTITFDGHDFKKEWEWFYVVLYAQHPPYDVTYFYDLTGQILDDYDNVYDFTETSAQTLVTVPDGKRALCGLAYSFNIIAIAFGVAAAATACDPVLGPSFSAASSAFLALAQGMGAGAADPPEPDPLYARPVVIPELQLPAEFGRRKEVRPIVEALQLVSRIGLACCALPQIESRILGAREAKNRKAEKMQRAALTRARQVIRSSARRLDRIAQVAVDTVKKHPAVSSGKIAAEAERLVVDANSRRQLTPKWLAAGGTRESLERIIELLANPTARRLASGVPLALAIEFAMLAAANHQRS